MGEILGLGVTHYPRFASIEAEMAVPLRFTLEDPGIPEDRKDPASWPPAMQDEWANEQESAAIHARLLSDGFRRVREALDAFQPDVVIIWADDQYENFREDAIPPFSVLAYPDLRIAPWATSKRQNKWGEDADFQITVKGAPEFARELTAGLLERDIDMTYAYRPLHYDGLAHAFLNTVLFLDQDRTGFPYPVVSVPVNCYGSRVIANKGRSTWFSDSQDVALDPPSPSPARCMQLGAATVDFLGTTDLRCAVVASSSWSHAFLVDKNWHLYPDMDADRALYGAFEAGDWATWREWTLTQVEESGQQELLNWFCLAGAMEHLDRLPTWSTFVETHVFNSNKCFAIFEPKGET